MTRLGRALLGLFLANLGAVVVIWLVDLDAHTFASLGAALSAAGRITALVGTYLILVQLVLRTHIPWLVGAFGKDALKAWHTWNAYLVYGLIAAHVALQIVGYALQDRVDLVGELGLLLGHYEGMVLAFASFALLTVLTVLALDRYRHRIPWPTWRALHLYAYVAVALSVPHMIATGSDFIEAPLAVAYWTALELTVFAILVAARVPPLWRAATATGRPHPAIVAVGTLIVAAYLVSSVRFAPAQTVAATTAGPAGTLRPAPTTSAGPARPSPSLPASTAAIAVEGLPFDTPYGPTQVRVILTAGRITDVEPMLLPAATRNSRTISASAEYWLRKRAITAQSASFDVLSGATYTSRAYQASLESALVAAGLE